MSKIKLIATDMDGTFLNNQMNFDQERFAWIFKKLTASKILFVVASGNQYAQLQSFFKKYPQIIYVAENGAYLRNQQQVFAISSYSFKAVATILEKLQKMEQLKVNSFNEIDDSILKFGINCPPKQTTDIVSILKQSLKQVGVPTSSGLGDIDVVQPGINKAWGLSKIGARFGIGLNEMCAFGDGGNDIEMLQAVGEGVAMSNALPIAQEAADFLTTSNQQAGVLQYIEQILARRS